MFKIKIFCPFSESKNCKEVYEKINYANENPFYGKIKKIYITDEDEYTHAIIINTIMPELKIPKENVIGLAFEPIQFLGLTQEFINYAIKHIGKYFIGDKFDLPNPFIEHFGYMWHSRPPAEIIVKPNLMSIVVSKKKSAPGHIYRHKLVEKIISDGDFWRGTKHFVSPTKVSKYELVDMISKSYNLNLEINPINSDITVDRTLSTKFENKYEIKELSKQIVEMAEFSKTLYSTNEVTTN